MEETLTILKNTPLFRDLTDLQARKILEISREITFSRNETIMEEGKTGDSMYIIIKGSVEVIRNLTLDENDAGEKGKNKVLTKLSSENHALFGEIGLLEESRRTATVRALTDCTLREIKKGAFLALAESDHELGYRVLTNLAHLVSSRLRKADDDIVKLATVLSMVLQE